MFYPLNPELATVCDLATWPSPVPSRSQTVPTDRWSSIDRSPAQGTRRLAQVLHKFQEDLLRHVSVLIAALEVSAGGCPAQMSGRNHVSVCVCVCVFLFVSEAHGPLFGEHVGFDELSGFEDPIYTNGTNLFWFHFSAGL